MGVYPYRFVPIYLEKIWGGRALERLFGRQLPPAADIGESWELADLPQGQSVVAEGPDAGKTLAELLAEKGPEILGRPGRAGPFPLLLKLLDANDVLSLQVHPDVEAAEALGPPAVMKTECWYVLESRRGYLLKGVADGVTEARMRQALEADDAEALRRLVRRFDVKAGDFHYLPAGTVHALGAGLVVAEIQTPSDTTYRVSDWGRGRDIHVAQALRCIHFEPPPAEPPGSGGEVLVQDPHFRVRRRVHPPGRTDLPGGQCLAWMVLSGTGRLRGSGQELALSPGQTVLLPAAVRQPSLEAAGAVTYLEVSLPD